MQHMLLSARKLNLFICIYLYVFVFACIVLWCTREGEESELLGFVDFMIHEEKGNTSSISGSLREWRSQIKQDLLDLNSPSMALLTRKYLREEDEGSLLVKGEIIADYVPTPATVVRDVVASMKLKESDVTYELGCGDAPFSIEAVQKYLVEAFCIENDRIRVDYTKGVIQKLGISSHLRIVHEDIMKLNISELEANALFLFLMPEALSRLSSQLRKFVEDGGKISSTTFPIYGLELRQRIVISHVHYNYVYIY